jgi:hypothetical protein
MRFPFMLLVSATLIAPSGAAFAGPGDPTDRRSCAEWFDRHVACPIREGLFDDDPDPLLVSGGLLALGGVAGGALALSNSNHRSGALLFTGSAPQSASP